MAICVLCVVCVQAATRAGLQGSRHQGLRLCFTPDATGRWIMATNAAAANAINVHN